MFCTPRLIVAAAALAIVAAVVAWIYRQGGDDVMTSSERQNNEAGRTADDVRTRFDLALRVCGTSAPASADGFRRVVGTDLIGARSGTPADQRKIDRTVVGICAAAVWTKGECAGRGEGR
ncbi:hypothetical protein GOC57_31835 [Sinorhizobium meliloti]|nr:hypothetical protein [Sinorhizobium meliloti]MDW9378397.1 hypothetical protein [Sinorhizobium meliloti]MDW9496751.1 hypothetical protein [Sinorhizobium meliloti]MDW9565367.1 hypothetical protein [Sinorhizobium meliloti]MDW9652743.1 hypothetical protein [Sinorhizobium meliloti]MDW9863151.1 hypothetical protein [Sinorhizobium meliloti]